MHPFLITGLSAALDMVEAAISSLENQARQAKLYEQKLKEEKEKVELVKKEHVDPFKNQPSLSRPVHLKENSTPAFLDCISKEVRKDEPLDESDSEAKLQASAKVRHRSPRKRKNASKSFLLSYHLYISLL